MKHSIFAAVTIPLAPWIAILACVAGPSAASAEFTGQYLGSVTITNGTTPSPSTAATAEIVPRAQFPGTYLVTLRDGTFNPSLVAFDDGVLLRGGDVLSNGVHRTLTGGFRPDGRTLFLSICLGPDQSLHQCDIRVFLFEGVLAPYGACVLPGNNVCVFDQAFFCALLGGQYIGDGVLCQEIGACTLNGICSIKTADGCTAVGGTFDGVGSRCPLPGETIHWINTQGGDYAVVGNWDPAQVPVHNAQRSDAALFISVSTVLAIPINGPQATAGRWEILDSAIAFSGDATLSSTSALPPSLAIGFGGRLNYDSGFLTTQQSIIGAAPPQSRVTLNTSTTWFNLGNLKVGTNGGAGGIELGELSFLNVDGRAAIGSGGDGELMVNAGAVAQLQGGLSIGSIFGGSGSVTVSGSAATRRSRLSVTGFTGVGNPLAASGSPGFLTVKDGAEMEINGDFGISHSVAGTNQAAVTIQSASTIATVIGAITVGELGPGDLQVEDGATVFCTALNLGSLFSGAGGELGLVGLASGIIVDQNVQVGGSGGHGLINVGTGTFLDVTGNVTVGHVGGGELILNSQAHATIRNGLFIGSLAGGAGAVVVSGVQSGLDVTGLTVVGTGPAISTGSLTVRAEAKAVVNGNFNVSHFKPDPNTAAVLVASLGVLDVNGDIVLGVFGPADMIITSATAECTDLTVGGGVVGASGFLVLEPQALMFVEDAQIGGNGGYGLVRIDSGATLDVRGTLTVGSTQGGLVTVNGQITGTGLVMADPGGIVDGNGRISASKVTNGGIIAPGLSPGTLTIDGDYEQLPGGVLVMEYTGLNPGEFDKLHVMGQTTLGGRLEVHFRNGFSPVDPQAFIHAQSFVEADQGLTGEYEERIYAFPDLFADFNNDQDKDFSDVAAFQNCFGLSGGALGQACDRADWEDNNDINATDARELANRLSGPK